MLRFGELPTRHLIYTITTLVTHDENSKSLKRKTAIIG
jgi:hypothetical protein